MTERKFLMVPEYGPVKIDTDLRPDNYVLRATMEVTGRMRAYELEAVIRALENEGYEVRKKDSGDGRE